jgi:glycosyltransferase 2 family protein
MILGLGCAVSATCVFFLIRRVDVVSVMHSLRTVGWGSWLGAATIYVIAFIPRTLRWQLMLAPSGRFRFADLWRCIILGHTGNNLLPFRAGELVRAVVFNRLTGTSTATGFGSVMAERLLDGFTIVLILAGVLASSASLATTPENLKPIYYVAALLSGAALIVLLCAWFATDTVVRCAQKLSPRLGAFAADAAKSVLFLRSPRLLMAVASLSLLVWLVEGSVFVALAHAIGVPSPITTGFLSLAVVNLGILIPSAPGYVGVFQAAAVLAFSALHRPEAEGVAFGILVHSAQFLPLTLIGLILAIPFWTALAWAIRQPAPSPHA